MANHFTFSYPPPRGHHIGSGAAATEILVGEDHALEAVAAVVRTIEFLRMVYSGGPGTDLFAVPPLHIGGVEDAGVLPARPGLSSVGGGGGNSSSSGGGGGQGPSSPPNAFDALTTPERSEVTAGGGPPSWGSLQQQQQQPNPATGGAAFSSSYGGRSAAGGGGSGPYHNNSAGPLGPPAAGVSSTTPSAVSAAGGGGRRPYDSVLVPVSTLANRSAASALHAAQLAVMALPYTCTLRRSGAPRDAPNAAPFVLRVRLCKPRASGLFGIAGRAELFEEWEFAFVKVKLATNTSGLGGSVASPSGTATSSRLGLNASAVVADASMTFGPQVALEQPTPLQHALGVAPNASTINDPGKLRDVLHFINTKAMEALETFVIDELRVNPEIIFDVSITPNERASRACHQPAGGGAGGGARSTSPAPVTDAAAGSSAETVSGGAAGVVGAIGGSIASFWRRR